MNKKEKLKQIVIDEVEIYKNKNYKELQSFVDNNFYYEKLVNSNNFIFEIRGFQINKNMVSICVEGKRKNFFAIGFAIYFAKSVDNKLIENTDDIIF